MDLLLDGSQPPKSPEKGVKRFLKPLVATTALVLAFILTVQRRGPEGGIGVLAQQGSQAAPARMTRNYDLGALKIFTVVLGRIKNNYVDPQRIKPREMLLAALNVLLFAFYHRIFGGWLAVGLSVAGGVILTTTFLRSRNFWIVTAVHGVLGVLVFLTGLGPYFTDLLR